MKRKLLSILALLLFVSGAWADWTGGTYTATVDEVRQVVYVYDDATLTINPGVTVTVNDGIHISDGKTLTITGGGTLLVTGASGVDGNEGGDAIRGNVIINGVTVSATGGKGGNGIDGSPGEAGNESYGGTADSGGTGGEGGQGGQGGAAFSGQVIMINGTIMAYGGQGGAGGAGGQGGQGGYGNDQYVTVDDYDGEEIIGSHEELTATGYGGDGGQGGFGGDGGDGGYAFAGTLIFYGGRVEASGGEGGYPGFPGAPGTGGGSESSGEGSEGSPGSDGESGSPKNAFYQVVTKNAASYTMTNGNYEIIDNETDWHVVYITADNATFIVDSGSCGTNVTWSLNILGQLTITGTGAMTNYMNTTLIPWKDNRSSITSVVIEDGVTSIGEYAFAYCPNLATVTLNSNPSISTSAFESIKSGATITMNLTANEGETSEYWTTFYNENYNFQAADGTQIFKAALSGSTLALTELTTDQIVTKNNAVILKSTASPIVLTLTTTDSNNSFSENSLLGVNNPAGLTASDPSTTYVLNKKTAGVGFYKLKAGKTVGVGKAYLTYPSTSAPEFLAFDETTSVADVRSKMSDVRGDYFDLQGRRVQTSYLKSQTSNLKKGLYIVNGRKVVIK